MKRNLAVAAAVGLFLAALLLARSGWSEPQGEKKAEAKAKLDQLRKERIETLEKVVEHAKIQYELGAGANRDLATFNAAQEELVEAKLDATDKPEERITLLKEQLKIAQEVSDYNIKSHDAGFRISDLEVGQAKAHALKIEIQLAKEELKLEDSKAAENR
jgi:hypothetical protein